jgi:alpha-glucosidase
MSLAGSPRITWILALTLASPHAAAAQAAANPVADQAATVVTGNTRITVLTAAMLRLEWAADGRFEDRPSLVFLNRRLPVPDFTVRSDGEWTVVETDRLVLRHRTDGAPFDSANLEIRVRVGERTVRWHPGTPDTANLGGTIRTLDGVQGPVPVGEGLVSRDGWSLVDDTERPLLDDSDWPWVEVRPAGARQDWYFLGYGHDYEQALHDFTKVAGRIPLPPRFAFGNWWSRYWAYTDSEFMELVGEFETYGVPLDVLVIDMDWHETFELRWDRPERDQAGQRLGWTGYTWNRAYFPDPEAFLSWAEGHGLKTPLNLHPASGIQPHEAQYTAMARAMGVDPASGTYIPFRIEDKKFAEAYFEHVIHPLERQGVDFWWLDWQQWHETSIPGLTPTWWLNYVFFTERERHGAARPILFHRYGGLGNHRYQIGFSGDAHSTWEMLAFEPYFTATASNVLYGYWSHDIGGHQPGPVSPELYTRWIQFGALSPVFRTHTTKNPLSERRIWAYPVANFRAMKQVILLRYALLPYIYTMAREAYDSGISLLRPMYYAYPEREEAYVFRDQYFFGDDLLVSPVAAPMHPDTLLAARKIWLPEGQWLEWFTGAWLDGGQVVERDFALDEIPLYARAGAIVPMQRPGGKASNPIADPLVLTVVPGADGALSLYEDDGETRAYERSAFARTPVTSVWHGDTLTVRIGPVEGSWEGMPATRGWEVRVPGVWPPQRVELAGAAVPQRGAGAAGTGWHYEGEQLALVVEVPARSVHEPTTLAIAFPARDRRALGGVPGLLRRLERATAMLDATWPDDWAPDAYVALAQTGRRVSLASARAEAEVTAFWRDLPVVLEQMRGMRGDSTSIRRALNHLRPWSSLPANRR